MSITFRKKGYLSRVETGDRIIRLLLPNSQYSTDKGIVKAVFGWPAIHTRRTVAKSNSTTEIYFLTVDALLKKEVEELGIHVGCVVTYEDEFMILNNRYFVGRA
ncbi:MAG: hypothetical protein R3B93_08080 [Bacteroidia bacterium]